MVKNNPNEFEKQWQKRFSSYGSKEDSDAAIAGWRETGLITRLNYFKKLWEGESKTLWLDAGCGAGTYSRYLVAKGCSVIALDYSQTSLVKAKCKGVEKIEYVAGNVNYLPFKENQFAGAICLGVTQAIASTELVLDELLTTIAPGGVLWIDCLNLWSVPNLWDYYMRKINGRKHHVRYERPKDFMKKISQAGFVNAKLHWMPILPSKLHKLQWLVETSIFRCMLRRLPFFGMFFSHSFMVKAAVKR